MLINQRQLVLIIATAAMALAGCSSTTSTQIGQFGTAVDQLTNEIDIAISETNQKHINYQLTKIRNSAQLNTVDANYTCPILLSKHGSNVDPDGKKCTSVGDVTFADITPIYTENEIKGLFLTRGNKALKGYAQSLQKLNDVSSIEQINASVVKLNNSMVGIYNQYEALSGNADKKEQFQNSLSVVAAAVNAIGTSIVEEKRREALKTTIIEAEPWINSLATQMADELKKGKYDTLIGIYDKKELDLNLFTYNQLMKKGELSDSESKAQLEELYIDWKNYTSRKLKRKQLVKSVNAIATAHTKLRDEVDRDIFSSSEISTTISDLRDHYKKLSSFHELLAACDGTLELVGDAYDCKTK